MMGVIGRVSGLISAKYLIAGGAFIIACAMYNLTNLYGDLNFGWFVWQRVYIGIGLPMIFIPITSASYDGIPPDKTDQASALINMARNTGGSIGVSIGQNVLAYREQFHQSRLVEHVVPSSPAYQEQLANLTAFFQTRGSGAVEAARQALGAINQSVAQQAAFQAYIDVFVALGIMALSAIPLALMLRATTGAAKGAH
jgi:DHA2 family multidrug resistance protein